VKLLLTSAGIKNMSIHDALVDLLGKPIAESNALCIPTATHAIPGGAGHAWRLINGRAPTPLCELGWKSLGVLELTALPSVKEELWVPMVQDTDALLVGGGDCLYLCYWMRKSGLADLLPSLRRETVYVEVSAGSMVVTSIGIQILYEDFGGTIVEEAYDGLNPPAGSDRALGLVNFSLFPHLDGGNPENSLANFGKLAATTPVPTYAIDDQTAIKVTDGTVEVVSEGHWKLFTP
jgi:dipeptidase E